MLSHRRRTSQSNRPQIGHAGLADERAAGYFAALIAEPSANSAAGRRS